MQASDESTPDFTTQTKTPSSWEESLPLPESTKRQEIALKEVAAEHREEKEPQTAVGKPKQKRSLLLNKKVVILFIGLFILGVVVVFGISILKRLPQAVQEVLKTGLEQLRPQIQPKISLKRISSAFVPKTPSQEPADLSVNWIKVEDKMVGFAFFHPEEWQVVKDTSFPTYNLFYPAADGEQANFGKTVFAKFSIFKTQKPESETMEEFLLKRYNFFNVQVKRETSKNLPAYNINSNDTFVFGIEKDNEVFILEGKVARQEDFEIYLPIFANIAKSFQIL